MKYLFLCSFMAVVLCGTASASEDPRPLPKNYEVVGESVVKMKSFASDPTARRKIDSLVPKLLKIGKGRVIRIEGAYTPSRDRGEQVEKSLNLAKEVEKYLRTKHNLPLDLYIAVRDDIFEKRLGNSVRIVVYPLEFTEQKL